MATQVSDELVEERTAEEQRCESCGSAIPDRVCANCGAAATGPYCSQCGQKEFLGRHTMRRMVSAPLGKVLNLDRGFFHTIVRLTVAPGHVVRDYLAGRVASYTHPVLYLLISFAAFALLARWTDAARPAPESDPSWMLPVVFIAALSRLLFWRAKLNYAEHLILCGYLVGHVMLFLAVLLVPSFFTGWLHFWTASLVVLGLGAGYVAWAYSRFFDRRPFLAAAGGLAAVVGGTALFAAAYLPVLIAILNAMRSHEIETLAGLFAFYLTRLWSP